jgi:catechol 2,3-dioxygenase
MAASRAVSFLYIIPVMAYLIAWVWLGEVPTAVSVVGGVMTLSGVLIINTAVGGGSCCRITRPRTEREVRDVETEKQTRHVINPKTCIGHVHLKVANIERALGFYRDILGFEITQWYGEDAVFLSAGGYHHHIGLNTWMSRNASPAPRNAAGLYHLAILYPSRSDLAQALSWLLEANYPIDGASDHGVSEALYLRDPDDNGVELAADRPEERWPRDRDGNLAMVTRPLDVEDLLAELGD